MTDSTIGTEHNYVTLTLLLLCLMSVWLVVYNPMRREDGPLSHNTTYPKEGRHMARPLDIIPFEYTCPCGIRHKTYTSARKCKECKKLLDEDKYEERRMLEHEPILYTVMLLETGTLTVVCWNEPDPFNDKGDLTFLKEHRRNPPLFLETHDAWEYIEEVYPHLSPVDDYAAMDPVGYLERRRDQK